MKLNTICAATIAALVAGCATQGEPRTAWTVEPVLDVRHGMQDAGASYQLGRYHHRQGRLDKAEAAYLRALAVDDHHTEALAALGVLYAARGEPERSVSTFERVVSLAPLASHLHSNLGYALLLTGQAESAARALRRAVQLDGNNRRAWRNLAEAYRRLGEPANAELAEGRASGRAPEPRYTHTPAAQPMPVRSDAPEAVSGSASPLDATSPANPRAASGVVRPAMVIQTNSGSRLVKIAENVYELRIVPTAAGTSSQGAAMGITAMAVRNVVPDAQAIQAPTSNGSAANSAAPVAPTVTPSPPVRYEVSNGHGRNGLARRVATLLQQGGMKFPRLTNQRPFNVPVSVVQYRPGYRDAAEALAARLPFRPATHASPSAGLVSDVRLVLGRDLGGSEACAELDLCPRLAVGTIRPAVAATGAGEQAPN